jgi:hypothetical protein
MHESFRRNEAILLLILHEKAIRRFGLFKYAIRVMSHCFALRNVKRLPKSSYWLDLINNLVIVQITN